MLAKIAELFNKIVEYFELKVRELKLKTIQTASSILTILVLIITLSSFAFLFILFGSLALSSILNDLLNSTYLGYVLVACIYLLLILMMIVLFRRGIINKWLQTVILKSLNKTEDEAD